MRKTSLKTKISVFVLVAFCVSVPLATHLTLSFFRGELVRTVQGQQMILVSRLAEELDEELRTTHQALIAAAKVMDPAALASPLRAEAALKGLPALVYLFDNGIFLFSPAGKLVAETAQTPPRLGLDVSHREYVRETLRKRAPHISAPFLSSQPHRHPSVMFTAPVFGRDGRLAGILGGSVDLMKNNLIGSLSGARLGSGGQFHLFTADGTIIMHPDRSRILRQIVEGETAALARRATAEKAVSGETSDEKGAALLTSLRRMRYVPWVLAADFPRAEAYEPVRQAERAVWWILLPGGFFIVGVMWLVMRHLTRPMLSLTEQIREIGESGIHRNVLIRSGDEIEQAADAFNSLMNRLNEKELRLYHLSNHDAMTDLYNRLFFDAELERLARGRNFPVSVIMADLDGLKRVNDTLGHTAGDQLIVTASLALRAAFRAEDVVARIGGDEFAVIIEGADEQAADEALARIRECVSAFSAGDDRIVLSLSLGAATATGETTLVAALRLADERMYTDKATRRERGSTASPLGGEAAALRQPALG